MVTVSHVVKKIVSEMPFIEEGLSRGIISYGNFAEEIKPKIEAELGKKVKDAAIIMALRRHAEQLEQKNARFRKFNFKGEILMKTSINDFTVVRSDSLLPKLKSLYSIVNFERGDTLNIILGTNEVSIIINDKHNDKLKKILKGEKILRKENNLVSLTVSFSGEDFFETPGVIFTAVKKLAWENINIYEIVSTMTELTFILSKKNSMKAYDVLQELVGNKK